MAGIELIERISGERGKMESGADQICDTVYGSLVLPSVIPGQTLNWFKYNALTFLISAL